MLKLKQNKQGRYFLSLVGKNGKILMTSEDYAKKGNAERAFEDIIEEMEECVTNERVWKIHQNRLEK